MISIEQINGEIAVLEEQVPTHVIMQKLAALYIVRDHMGIAPVDNGTAPVSVVQMDTMPKYGDTEFYELIAGKPIVDVMAQVNELMATVQVLNPRLYDSVIRKLFDI